jgi:hypothetical protein
MISLVKPTLAEINAVISSLLAQNLKLNVSVSYTDLTHNLDFGRIESHNNNSIKTELTDSNLITYYSLDFVEEHNDYDRAINTDLSLFQFDINKHALHLTLVN